MIGTVVISEECYNGELEPFFKLAILGEIVKRPSKFDAELAQEIFNQRWAPP